MSRLKQATISSLKGVVIVKDFLRNKHILDNPDEPDDYVLDALNELKQKKPAKEIIKSTGIGTTLEMLKNHSNENIANEAKSLCELWKITGEVNCQPMVEVRYDNLTYHIRKTSVKFFSKELGGREEYYQSVHAINKEDEKLADVVEKEIFHTYKRLISKNYRRTVRKITFVLRHEKTENEALKLGKIAPKDFVKKYLR